MIPRLSCSFDTFEFVIQLDNVTFVIFKSAKCTTTIFGLKQIIIKNVTLFTHKAT